MPARQSRQKTGRKTAKDGPPKGKPAEQPGQAGDPLRRYRERRDSRRSGEPAGKWAGRGGRGQPRFVVQQHDATGRLIQNALRSDPLSGGVLNESLHYDFRLESGGVLKSWAVPKGPSADPRDKRLAMPTEDHPLDYAGFEGVIPKGEYGAGPVIVWDHGTYQNETEDSRGKKVDLDEGIERGHIKFRLAGQKLRGGYSLTRMDGGGRDRWLLVKMADDFAAGNGKARGTTAPAGAPAAAPGPESVQSGKTIEQVAEQAGGSG